MSVILSEAEGAYRHSYFLIPVFFYVSAFGLVVVLFLPALAWTDSMLEKRLEIIGAIAFFAVFTHLFKHLRKRSVVVFVDAEGIRFPQLNIAIDQSDLRSLKVKHVANGGYSLQAQTSKANLVVLVGTVLWAGRYLDITLGQKR